MYDFDLYFLFWLAVKFIVDLVSLVFIFWRLTHHRNSRGEEHGHKGDFYYLLWLGIKFVIDSIMIVGYMGFKK